MLKSKRNVLVKHCHLILCASLAIIPALTKASDSAEPIDSPAGIAFFESKIRPVLVEQCYECHSAQAGVSEGELQLDSRKSTRKGGDRGPAVVPGDPQASWLLVAMSHADSDLKMPPKRKRLPDATLDNFKKWIEIGAPDPRADNPLQDKEAWEKARGDFWAYQPPRLSEPPPVTDVAWPKKTLDYFILAKLEQHELSPSPDTAAASVVAATAFRFGRFATFTGEPDSLSKPYRR